MNELIREIAHLIEKQSGFVIGDQSLGALESIVGQRLRHGGFSGFEGYADYLRRHPVSEEWRHLLSKITIKESYLFRAKDQFDALTAAILEETADRRQDRRLRVWCAGCARGEEAATLAIVLADHPDVGSWNWSVLATDVDVAALGEARRGLFNRRAVDRVPRAILGRYFSPRGDRFELDPRLRERVEYRQLNLVELPLDLGDDLFDLIFLRNVLIYFRPELQRRVVEGVEQVLAPGGTLFLGPSESLLHLGTTLRARDLGKCFCYQRPTPSEDVGLPAPSRRNTISDAEPVGDASDSTSTAHESDGGAPRAASFEARLESTIRALERGANHDAAVSLADLRRENPESATVHALEGLAFERLGDREGSVHAYRAALYLAPEMDEVRFLLARSLDGLGRTKAAAREYRTVLSGLGPTSSFSTAVLGRMGLPDVEQMRQISLEYLDMP